MQNLPIPESYWVKENLFLAGAYPGDYDSQKTCRRMDAFLESGIRVFIDLTHPHELKPYEPILQEEAHIYGYAVKHHRFSVQDHGVASVSAMVEILDAIDEALQNEQPVYVHCWAGIGRTGMTVGCYLVRHGMKTDEALQHVNALYKTRPDSLVLPRSPETETQADFVRAWEEGR
ncbi:MAG: dual specificity protein phosphatase family protein [Anaerolineales bacterium]|nr:dual specificity protein phosphatase family protein [Anaerolineales bacterium]